ncbi:MAG: hypothetical protein RLZZ591_2963 [Pseudomonadota bacterium]|jgi:hypothetical protein
MRSLQLLEHYLTARGCEIHRVKGRLIEFRLAGETSPTPGGRLSLSGDGSLKMWHRYAEKGLAAGAPWRAAGDIAIGDKTTPALGTHIQYLSFGEGLAGQTALSKLTKVPKFPREPGQHRTYDPEQVWQAADALLQSTGLTPSRLQGRYCDGSNQKPVYKLFVSDEGVATVFSFRNDVDLPAPWRQGRPTRDGRKTMFVTGKDLGLDGAPAAPRSLSPLPSEIRAAEHRPIDLDLMRDTCQSWLAGETPPADHRHLIKSQAILDGSDLRVYPLGHRFAGTMMAPMFRPEPMGSRERVEWCGVQHLMPDEVFSTDKIMAKGSRTIGAFVPFPGPHVLIQATTNEGLAPLQAWLAIADKDKPLVICEGVATGLAIQQSGAGNTLCALSSNNVVTIARWVKESGLADGFTGVVIATDHDIGRDATGRLKSNAIPRALDSARENGFVLAVPPATSQAGTDARDLLGLGGPQAVRDFIARAATASSVEKARADIFALTKQHQLSNEPISER